MSAHCGAIAGLLQENGGEENWGIYIGSVNPEWCNGGETSLLDLAAAVDNCRFEIVIKLRKDNKEQKFCRYNKWMFL